MAVRKIDFTAPDSHKNFIMRILRCLVTGISMSQKEARDGDNQES